MSGRGHHHGPGGPAARYDREAPAYALRWAPVLAAPGARLLARAIAAGLPADARIVELGAGTGTLALAARRALPQATIVATDLSAGMLAEAEAAAGAAGLADPDRLRFLRAPAAATGLPDASADLVLGAFVHQLVPDRAAVHAETLRILRPGGLLTLVTWQAGGVPPRASAAWDDLVVDLGLDRPVAGAAPDARAGDLASPAAAARELRRAGFRRVAARPDRLTWSWDAAGYLAQKEGYEEAALVATLSPAERERLRAAAAAAFARLPASAFTWDAPLVSVLARRPPAPLPERG